MASVNISHAVRTPCLNTLDPQKSPKYYIAPSKDENNEKSICKKDFILN